MASTNINNFTGALEVLLDGFSLGKMNSDVRSFLLNPANVPVIKQAIDYLGYSIPNNSSAPGIAKIKMLYFAAFYLKSFPLPIVCTSKSLRPYHRAGHRCTHSF
jgi:hypothetical protein